MNRRVLGVVASILLAAVGTYILVSYVNTAEERAVAGEETVEVLVVTETVPQGSSVDSMTGRVRTALVPAKVQATGSVASLAELAGQVAAVDLLPGEQVVEGRFITPEALQAQAGVDVPEGMLEVTVSLSPERAIGGTLLPGDTVAILASFPPFQLDGTEPGEVDQDLLDAILPGEGQGRTPNSTHIILHKALVTGIHVEKLPAETDQQSAEQSGVELAPTGRLLVTVALEAGDVEKFVFTAEHGSMWLAKEPLEADEVGTQIQTRNSIYR